MADITISQPRWRDRYVHALKSFCTKQPRVPLPPFISALATRLHQLPPINLAKGIWDAHRESFEPPVHGNFVFRPLLSGEYEAFQELCKRSRKGVLLDRPPEQYERAIDAGLAYGIFWQNRVAFELVAAVFARVDVFTSQELDSQRKFKVLVFFGATVQQDLGFLLKPLTTTVMGLHIARVAGIDDDAENGDHPEICAAGVYTDVYLTDAVASAYNAVGLRCLTKLQLKENGQTAFVPALQDYFAMQVKYWGRNRPYNVLLGTYEEAAKSCKYFYTLHTEGHKLDDGSTLTGVHRSWRGNLLKSAADVAAGDIIIRPKFLH